MNTKPSKTIGHCQACGRQQAVLDSGRMSQHGYVVADFGYFHGVCSGRRNQPIEVSRAALDDNCAEWIAAASSMEAAGPTLPKADDMVKGRIGASQNAPLVRFDSLATYRQLELIKSAEWKHAQTIKGLREHAAMMTKLANAVHGQPLKVEDKPTPPAPIKVGERRVSGVRVLECTGLRGPRVMIGRGWIGTQAWRKLPFAPD